MTWEITYVDSNSTVLRNIFKQGNLGLTISLCFEVRVEMKTIAILAALLVLCALAHGQGNLRKLFHYKKKKFTKQF